MSSRSAYNIDLLQIHRHTMKCTGMHTPHTYTRMESNKVWVCCDNHKQLLIIIMDTHSNCTFNELDPYALSYNAHSGYTCIILLGKSTQYKVSMVLKKYFDLYGISLEICTLIIVRILRKVVSEKEQNGRGSLIMYGTTNIYNAYMHDCSKCVHEYVHTLPQAIAESG